MGLCMPGFPALLTVHISQLSSLVVTEVCIYSRTGSGRRSPERAGWQGQVQLGRKRPPGLRDKCVAASRTHKLPWAQAGAGVAVMRVCPDPAARAERRTTWSGTLGKVTPLPRPLSVGGAISKEEPEDAGDLNTVCYHHCPHRCPRRGEVPLSAAGFPWCQMHTPCPWEVTSQPAGQPRVQEQPTWHGPPAASAARGRVCFLPSGWLWPGMLL